MTASSRPVQRIDRRPRDSTRSGFISRLVSTLNDEHFTLFHGVLLCVIASVPLFNRAIIDPSTKLKAYQMIKWQVYRDPSQVALYTITAAICLPMMADTLLDIVEMLYGRCFGASSSADTAEGMKADTLVKTTRLNVFERVVFILGACTMSITALTMDPQNVMPSFVRGNCATYVGIVAVYTAIMCCLQRCTKTWTPLRTNVAVALIGLGAICKNYRYIIIDPVLKNNVYNNGGILFLTGFSWMILWVLLSFASYAAEWRAKRRNGGGAEGRDSLQEQLGRLDDFYINIVPGGHMVALLVNCCVDMYYFNGGATGEYR